MAEKVKTDKVKKDKVKADGVKSSRPRSEKSDKAKSDKSKAAMPKTDKTKPGKTQKAKTKDINPKSGFSKTDATTQEKAAPSALATVHTSGVVSLFHGAGGLDVPMPFERDILVLESYIAGTSHVEGIEEIAKALKIGEELDLFRQPDNDYDDKAILVKTKAGVKLGYIKKAQNEVMARLMDAGKSFWACISDKEILEGSWRSEDHWVKISIKVYMHE